MSEIDVLRVEFSSVPPPTKAATRTARKNLLDQTRVSHGQRQARFWVAQLKPSPRAMTCILAAVCCLALLVVATPAGPALGRTWEAVTSFGEDRPPPIFRKLEHAAFPVRGLPPGVSLSAKPEVRRIPDPGWTVTWTLKRRNLRPNWIVSFRILANARVATDYFNRELAGWRRSPPPGGHLVSFPATLGHRSWTLESVIRGSEARRSCASARCVLLETDTLVGTVQVSTMTVTARDSSRLQKHLTDLALAFLHQVNANG